MPLVLSCPHCQHLQEDPFEVLLQDSVDWMKCEACEKPFFYAILDCPHCALETGYSWLKKPPDEVVASMTCSGCESTFYSTTDTAFQIPSHTPSSHLPHESANKTFSTR